jgi:hypothetical protein
VKVAFLRGPLIEPGDRLLPWAVFVHTSSDDVVLVSDDIIKPPQTHQWQHIRTTAVGGYVAHATARDGVVSLQRAQLAVFDHEEDTQRGNLLRYLKGSRARVVLVLKDALFRGECH